jgi:hypothetical protein
MSALVALEAQIGGTVNEIASYVKTSCVSLAIGHSRLITPTILDRSDDEPLRKQMVRA